MTDEEKRLAHNQRQNARRAHRKQDPKYRKALREQQREIVWRKFGGTLELFMKYWRKQKGRCGICGKKLTLDSLDRKVQPQFDHCHDTLRPRGLLCMRCNVKLDWFIRNRKEIEDYLQ